MKEAKEAPAYTVKGGLIMKYFIYALADRHGFDITGEGDGPRSMRLTLEPYPLFVEHVGKNLIAVGHRGRSTASPSAIRKWSSSPPTRRDGYR